MKIIKWDRFNRVYADPVWCATITLVIEIRKIEKQTHIIIYVCRACSKEVHRANWDTLIRSYETGELTAHSKNICGNCSLDMYSTDNLLFACQLTNASWQMPTTSHKTTKPCSNWTKLQGMSSTHARPSNLRVNHNMAHMVLMLSGTM